MTRRGRFRRAPGQTFDLAFDVDEPRDPATGRWTVTDHSLKLQRDIKAVLAGAGDYRKQLAGGIESWHYRLYHPRVAVLHDNETGKVVGHVVYEHHSPTYREVQLHDVRVDKSVRGQGGGAALIEHMKDVARAGYYTKGGKHRKLGLSVSNILESARGFYAKTGAHLNEWTSQGEWELAFEAADIDLARPASDWRRAPAQTSPYGRQTVTKHVVVPKPDTDATVRSIAKVLLSSRRTRGISEDTRTEVERLRSLMKPYGIQTTAIRMALGLTRTEGGSYRGTAHSPNARLRGYAAKLEGGVRDVRDQEVYFRASYLANAAQRLQKALNEGKTQREALAQEKVYYLAHERARRGRLESAAQVQTAGGLFGQPDQRGTLVGWYLNPLLNNEVECQQADGHNFYVEEGTVIGLPGSVHQNCGCYAGPPHQGAGLVDDVLGNVVRFTKSRPKFKLRSKRTA